MIVAVGGLRTAEHADDPAVEPGSERSRKCPAMVRDVTLTMHTPASLPGGGFYLLLRLTHGET